jgi:hypothetical protein
MSRAKPLRGADGALDILIFPEKGQPLRSTARWIERFCSVGKVERNLL